MQRSPITLWVMMARMCGTDKWDGGNKECIQNFYGETSWNTITLKTEKKMV
jgi:hypothetical protein